MDRYSTGKFYVLPCLTFTLTHLLLFTKGVEVDNQLLYQGSRVVGRGLHVHPDPSRICGSELQAWTPFGQADDFEYRYLFGSRFGLQGQIVNSRIHSNCTNPGCNRRDLDKWIWAQPRIDWTLDGLPCI